MWCEELYELLFYLQGCFRVKMTVSSFPLYTLSPGTGVELRLGLDLDETTYQENSSVIKFLPASSPEPQRFLWHIVFKVKEKALDMAAELLKTTQCRGGGTFQKSGSPQSLESDRPGSHTGMWSFLAPGELIFLICKRRTICSSQCTQTQAGTGKVSCLFCCVQQFHFGV